MTALHHHLSAKGVIERPNPTKLDLVANALNSGLQIWASVKFDKSFYCKCTVL